MKKLKPKDKKVIVAMSGGVDSSVAAALLKRAGFDVVGVFMKFWSEDVEGAENRCCSPEAEKRARKVASILKIPFYVLNFEKEFKRKIVDYFLREYKKGTTPNPCVVCNKEIKFGLLLNKALELDADFIATGHYARLERETSKYKLLRGKDRQKDQSYFLWRLNRKQLKRVLFPIGNYTKTQVRNLAKKFALPVLDIPESQEICFIGTTMNDFLEKYLKEKPGKIVDTEGKIIGKHRGLWFYTIGQRKGIKLAQGPYYVLQKDLKNNLLIVTKNEKDLEKKELIARNVKWISGKTPKLPLKVKAKIRYRHRAASAMITKRLEPKTYTLRFDRAQRAITHGQSVVFFSTAEVSTRADKNQELLGGGIISQL